MRSTRFLLRSGAVAAAVVTVSVCASPTQAVAPVLATGQATTLADTLGARSGGAYVDASGRTVVTVTDAAAAASVRAAGGTAKLVARNTAQLTAARTTLDRILTVPGTAYAVDPVSNQVVVSADSSVTGAKLTKVRSAVASLGGAAKLERTPGVFSTRISGGQAIYGASGGRCSLGFNVRSGSTYYFLTAGHCTDFASSWRASSGGATIGSTTGTSFPGDDYGIVRYSSTTAQPGNVSLYNGSFQDITSAGTPAVGQTVQRSGSTTGLRSGRVTALNATVNYAEGRVSGLIRTTVCAEPGDSGGSLFAGTTAYGLTSGGSGNCRSGGTTFFQPVTEALSRYGVSVY